MTAHGPEETVGINEGLEFFVAEHARVFQLSGFIPLPRPHPLSAFLCLRWAGMGALKWRRILMWICYF
jgi:hypothetical protein